MSYKQIFIAAILLAVLTPCIAASLKSSLAACGDIRDDDKRLACFDELLASQSRMTAAPEKPLAPVSQDAPRLLLKTTI